MKYNFDKIIERKGTGSLKWDFSEEFTGIKELFPMWVADMDFQSPPEIVKAVTERAAHGVYGYTGREDSYYNSVINWMKKRHNWDISKEEIIVSPGVIPLLNISVQTFTNPGDEIIIQSPVYYPFISSIENNGRKIIYNELSLDNMKYSMDLDKLEKSITPRTRMMIISNPHNPVARVWKTEELKKLSDICYKNNIIIISDEIHSDLIMEGHKHIPFTTVSDKAKEITITCTAPSKTFNLAGLQVANIIVKNITLRNKLSAAFYNCGIHLSNPFGISACEAAYNFGSEWLDQLLIYIKSNYIYLKKYLSEELPEIKVFPLEGTYLVWMDFSPLNSDESVLDKNLLNRGGIWLDKGSIFGPGGNSFMRINIACPRELLKKGLERIVKSFK